MKNLIKSYDNAFSPEFCQEIIDLGNSHRHLLKSRQENSKQGPNSGLIFQDLSMGLESILSSSQSNTILLALTNCFNLYVNEFPIMKAALPQGIIFSDCKFQKTSPTEGFHQWHSENVPVYPYNLRYGVWTIYLNDIEEGGETEFLYQSIRIKPKAGSINIFPPYYTHTHRGNPPLKETKYILTGWVEHAKILNSNMTVPELT